MVKDEITGSPCVIQFEFGHGNTFSTSFGNANACLSVTSKFSIILMVAFGASSAN